MQINQQVLKHFLHMMLRIRMFEEGLIEPILENEIRTPCHLYSGEEAIAVGLCTALSRDDYVFGNHRSHGHFLAKVGSMKQMPAEIGPPINSRKDAQNTQNGTLYRGRSVKPDSILATEADTMNKVIYCVGTLE